MTDCEACWESLPLVEEAQLALTGLVTNAIRFMAPLTVHPVREAGAVAQGRGRLQGSALGAERSVSPNRRESCLGWVFHRS